MAHILQTTISNAFSWKKMFVFWFQFHWILVIRLEVHVLINKSALVQVMALCQTEADPLCEPMLIKTPGAIYITRPQWVITLRQRQNGRHFADNIFKYIFFNENLWISIEISQKFVPTCPINNILALVQIMAWHQSGDKPLSETMMVSSASMS